MNKVLVHVNIDSFEGQVVANGEYISRCVKGSVIEINNSTYLALSEQFPGAFSMYNPTTLSLKKSFVRSLSINPIRILYLYMDDDRYRYDCWLRGEFIKQIAEYSNRTMVVYFYGLNSHLTYPQETPIVYDSKLDIKTICSLFKINVILVAQKSRMYIDYHPNRVDNNTWLPKDFSSIDVPKIVIEEDYHYEKDDSWYVENNISLILQRHYSQSLRQEHVPMQWFPFSVDTKIFKPSLEIDRIKQIAFVGSIEGDVYKYRAGVVEKLKKLGLCKPFFQQKIIYQDYIKNLQTYISHICCGSTFDITPAKSLEIMSSGSVLFTNKFKGIERMFPEEAYCSYKNDLSDVELKAKKILEDCNHVNEITSNGIKCIEEKHSHKIRIEQLAKIIKDVIGHKEVEQKLSVDVEVK